MVIAFAVAIVLGLAIVALTGPAVLFLALACMAVAILYTGGPVPLGYVALGEIAVFLAMGIAIVGGGFLALSGTITPMVLVVALPNAFLITSLIHINNLRDIDRDRQAGKRTVAMALGHDRSVIAYSVLVGAAYLSVVLIVVTSPHFWPTLAVAATVPRAIGLMRAVAAASSEREYSLALRGTNRLLTEFGLIMAGGLLAGAAFSGQLLVP
jgi:1,4-dihydroxy-2-naphthoate octaprenyltransferase